MAGIWPSSIVPASTIACSITWCRIANLQSSAMGSVALNESHRGVWIGPVCMMSRNEKHMTLVGWVELEDDDATVVWRSSWLSSFVPFVPEEMMITYLQGGAWCWCGRRRRLSVALGHPH